MHQGLELCTQVLELCMHQWLAAIEKFALAVHWTIISWIHKLLEEKSKKRASPCHTKLNPLYVRMKKKTKSIN